MVIDWEAYSKLWSILRLKDICIVNLRSQSLMWSHKNLYPRGVSSNKYRYSQKNSGMFARKVGLGIKQKWLTPARCTVLLVQLQYFCCANLWSADLTKAHPRVFFNWLNFYVSLFKYSHESVPTWAEYSLCFITTYHFSAWFTQSTIATFDNRDGLQMEFQDRTYLKSV